MSNNSTLMIAPIVKAIFAGTVEYAVKNTCKHDMDDLLGFSHGTVTRI